MHRRRDQQPKDLRRDLTYAVTSPYSDTWFQDEHDVWRWSYFATRAHAPSPRCARAPSPPPPLWPPAPEIYEEDEAFKKALVDSKLDELAQREGLAEQLALSAAGTIAVL